MTIAHVYIEEYFGRKIYYDKEASKFTDDVDKSSSLNGIREKIKRRFDCADVQVLRSDGSTAIVCKYEPYNVVYIKSTENGTLETWNTSNVKLFKNNEYNARIFENVKLLRTKLADVKKEVDFLEKEIETYMRRLEWHEFDKAKKK